MDIKTITREIDGRTLRKNPAYGCRAMIAGSWKGNVEVAGSNVPDYFTEENGVYGTVTEFRIDGTYHEFEVVSEKTLKRIARDIKKGRLKGCKYSFNREVFDVSSWQPEYFYSYKPVKTTCKDCGGQVETYEGVEDSLDIADWFCRSCGGLHVLTYETVEEHLRRRGKKEADVLWAKKEKNIVCSKRL